LKAAWTQARPDVVYWKFSLKLQIASAGMTHRNLALFTACCHQDAPLSSMLAKQCGPTHKTSPSLPTTLAARLQDKYKNLQMKPSTKLAQNVGFV
jgi:hypothetical protein